MQPTWRTFRDYFARLRKQGMGINLASYVGATQVRRMVLGDDDRAPNRGGTGAHEGAGARRHAGGRGGALHFAAIRPGALCEDRGVDRAGGRGGETRRHLRLAHPRRGRRDPAGAGRGLPHRARGEHSGGDLAFEGGREIQLGADAGDRRAHRGGAQIRAGRGGGHVRISGGVQYVLRGDSALGARWRRQEADRAAEGPGDAGAHSQGDGNAFERVEQRVAAGERAGIVHPERGAESQADAAAGEDPSRRSPSCGTRTRSTRCSTS